MTDPRCAVLCNRFSPFLVKVVVQRGEGVWVEELWCPECLEHVIVRNPDREGDGCSTR